MSDADLLRRAAALMRERAEAATPGPLDVSHWREGGETTHHTLCKFETRTIRGEERGGFLARQVAMTYADTQGHADFVHIASWHPAVALAVADWLDAEAESHRADLVGPFPSACCRMSQARAVARAFLGSDDA